MNLIGACCNIGQKKLGVELGPSKIIRAIIERKYPIIQSIIKLEEFNYDNGYVKLNQIHRSFGNNKVIAIGGDHSISAFTVTSSLYKYRENLKVLWLDAHADLNTRESSITKNTHGMSVASIIGLDNIWNLTLPTADPSQIMYMGLRDVDSFEKQMITKHNIEAYEMDKLDDIDNIENLNRKDLKYHVSIDIDVLDPIFAPATGTPVKNGMTMNQLINILNKVKENTVAYDIVEYNPQLKQKDDPTLDNIMKIIETIA